MPVTYLWQPGSRVNLDPQKAGEALAAIEKAHNGRIEPEFVVDAARPESSPLHSHFQWDDAVAAEAYRTDQAREIIRSLRIDMSRSNIEPPKPIRAYINVTVDDAPHYTSVTTAMSSRELRKQVISRAWAELEAWRQRHAELTELGRIFSMIDQGLEAPPDS